MGAVGAGDRGPVAIEGSAGEADLAGTDQDGCGGEPDDAGGGSAGFAVADPEQEVDVGLVGGLVVSEACVAVDAKQRTPNPRVSEQSRMHALQRRSQGVDERRGGDRNALSVLLAMVVEVVTGVVGGEAVEELPRFGGEAGEDASPLARLLRRRGMVDRELEGFVEQTFPGP